MRKIIILSIALPALLLLVRCSDNPVGPIGSHQTVSLLLHQRTTLKFDDLEVMFYRVISDSRCPMNAYCDWPGMGEIIVMLLKPPAHDPVYFPMAIVGTAISQSEFDNVPADIGEYRVELLGLTPYPESPGPVDTSAYTAKIKITKLGYTARPLPKVQITDILPDQILLDNYRLNGASINGDRLDLHISYGGECVNHYFWLFMSPAAFAESSPAQANLYLRHFDNGETCRSIVTNSLAFDLKPIGDLYQRVYGSKNSIRLNLFEYADSMPVCNLHLIYQPR